MVNRPELSIAAGRRELLASLRAPSAIAAPRTQVRSLTLTRALTPAPKLTPTPTLPIPHTSTSTPITTPYPYPYPYPYPLLTLTRRGPSCGALHGRAGAVLHDVRSTHRPTAPPSAPHPAPPHTAPTPTRKGQGSSPRPRVVRRVPHSYCCPTTHTNFIWVCFRFPNRTLPNQAPLPRRRR